MKKTVWWAFDWHMTIFINDPITFIFHWAERGENACFSMWTNCPRRTSSSRELWNGLGKRVSLCVSVSVCPCVLVYVRPCVIKMFKLLFLCHLWTDFDSVCFIWKHYIRALKFLHWFSTVTFDLDLWPICTFCYKMLLLHFWLDFDSVCFMW